MTPQPPRFDAPINEEMLDFRPRFNVDPVPPWLLKELEPSVRVQLGRVLIDHEIAVLRQRAETLEKFNEMIPGP